MKLLSSPSFLQPQFSIERYHVNFEMVDTDCMKTTGSVNLYMISWGKCLLKQYQDNYIDS